MKKLTAAWAAAFAVISQESFNKVADAWAAYNTDPLSIDNDNGDAFSSSPVSMLQVQWGERYKFVKPTKVTKGLEFVFETILGPVFDIKPSFHSHCAAVNVTFDVKQSKEYGKKTNIGNLDDCQQECHSDSKCVAAIYMPGNRSCHFLSTVKGLQANFHTIAVLPTCNGACFHDGFHLSGSASPLAITPNPYLCQAFCRADSACHNFSWNKKTRLCSRHSDDVALTNHKDFISGHQGLCTGLLPSNAAGNSIYSNAATSGNHYAQYPRVANWEACRQRCLNDRRCASYDYVVSSQICYMKTTRNARRSASGMQTGTRYNDTSCHKKGYLLSGKTLKTINEVNHPSECHTECFANTSCKKWTLHPTTKVCMLFGDVTTAMKLLTGAYYGPKEPCRNDAVYQYSNLGCARLGIKYGGEPIESVSASDPAACQSKCINSNFCETYSYDMIARKCHFHLAVAVKKQEINDRYVSGPQKCSACHSHNSNYYSGEQVGEVDNVETADECQLHCQAKGYCASWSYATDSKECTFYKDGAVARSGKNNITGPKYCDGDCDLRGFQASTPNFGFSQSAGRKSLQDCRNACRNNKNCVIFTHLPDTTCTLGDATNLTHLTAVFNRNNVVGFPRCASCLQQGVAYRVTPQALLWSIMANSGQECQERCELMEECAYFSYNVKSKQCSLLSGMTEEEKSEHLISGPSQCIPKANCLLENVGLTDVDNISTKLLASVQVCQEKCKADVTCKFFTYEKAKKLCTLKSGGLRWKDHLRTQPQKGFVSGTKKCVADGDEKSICESLNHSFFGRSLNDNPLKAKDAKECRRMCLKEPRCRFWVYNKSKKECTKKALTGAPMQNSWVPNNNILAGARMGCPKCLRAGIAYGGIKLMAVTMETAALCQQGCEVVEECEVFTFVNKVCTLYMRATGPQSASSTTISGPRQC